MRGFRELQGMEDDMEIYLMIAELAGMVKLSGQTIRRYVLNKTIPYQKDFYGQHILHRRDAVHGG
jgi:hypothetical protein